MVQFQELPIDILPVILSFLFKSSHLASAAKVNKVWNEFATPRLYERISVFSWQKEWKKIVCSLFSTLASYPHLARHVRRLEIRDFPKSVHWDLSPETTRIIEDTNSGLKNCTNLRSCTWTRDGSLTDDILNALASLPNLYELEVNGHDSFYYHHEIFCKFTQLHKIVVIMPSTGVVRSVKDMVIDSGEKLRSFTMICKSSGAVTDQILEEIAPKLANLEHFSLIGCPKVTERGVLAIVSSTRVGIKSLGLENLSAKFDMAKLSEYCNQTQALHFLESVTLTVSHHVSQRVSDRMGWTKAARQLLAHSPLKKFHVYSTHIAPAGALTNSEPEQSIMNLIGLGPFTLANILALFYSDIVAAHGKTLTRFSVLRMPVSLVSIRTICEGCPNLEELFVVTDSSSLDDLPLALAPAKKLRTVHINFPVRVAPGLSDPLESESDIETGLEDDAQGAAGSDGSRTFLSQAEGLELVKKCSPSLTQFGCNTKVWKVGRKTMREEDGSVSAEVVLLPYENPDIPEPFLVVRT